VTRRDPVEALAELSASDDDKARRLSSDDVFGLLVADLAEKFILLTLIPQPERRRVLSLSYTTRVSPESRKGARQSRRSRLQLLLGWRLFTFGFPLGAAGEAASFHFEMEAGPNLRIREGEGQVTLGGKDVSARVRSNVHILNFELLHVYLSGVSRRASATAVVAVGPPLAFVAKILGVVAFNATLLILGSVFFDEVSRKVSGSSVDAGVAVLLVASSLVSAYFARPGEHESTSRALFGLRAIGLISGISTYVAAVTLTVGPEGALGHAIWTGLAGIVSAATLLLLPTYFLTRRRDRIL
jgi:hypothetical protein